MFGGLGVGMFGGLEVWKLGSCRPLSDPSETRIVSKGSASWQWSQVAGGELVGTFGRRSFDLLTFDFRPGSALALVTGDE